MIKEANQLALSRLQNATPRLIDIRQAKDVIKDFDEKTILHAGPPIEYQNMCAPMQEAIHAALIYEELAKDLKEARTLASSGEIRYVPCHERGVVGPMTGITSWSMPLLVVENTNHGNFAYSTINEGAGDVIRFGGCTENTIKRLKWIENVLAPVLKKVILSIEGLDLGAMMSQAISMSDELHMRNIASSMILLYKIATPLSEFSSGEELKEIMNFLTTRNDQFFLNFAMAANKSSADAASGIPN